MSSKLKVVHYLNQFYGGIGGEEKADIEPQVVQGPVGPGLALQETFDVAATVICGDNYFAEHTDEAGQKVLAFIKQFSPDLVLAGPAFNAGRYGVACGEVCKLTTASLGIPAVTAMYEENPGVSLYQSDVVIVKAGLTARTMKQTVEQMAKVGQKILSIEEINPAADQYFSQGIKRNKVSEYTGAQRAVNMLLAKLQKQEFVTEIVLPEFDAVSASKLLSTLSKAKIALVTDGGLYPKGNPDKVEAGNATKFGRYSIKGSKTLESSNYEVYHGGYDTRFAAENPNRLVPVDAMRMLESEGFIGELHSEFYATSGVSTPIANSQKFGREIADILAEAHVDAVILTST